VGAAGLPAVEPPLLQPATRTLTTINDANKHQIILFFMISPPDSSFHETPAVFDQAFTQQNGSIPFSLVGFFPM
jgi:hypothetical protein